jgi:hypothetical protein
MRMIVVRDATSGQRAIMGGCAGHGQGQWQHHLDNALLFISHPNNAQHPSITGTGDQQYRHRCGFLSQNGRGPVPHLHCM